MAFRVTEVRRPVTRVPPGVAGVRKVTTTGLVVQGPARDFRGAFVNPPVRLTWSHSKHYGPGHWPSSYAGYQWELLRNGTRIAVLPPAATEYLDHAPGVNPTYILRGIRSRRQGFDGKEVSVTVITYTPPTFRPVPVPLPGPPPVILECPLTLTILSAGATGSSPTRYAVAIQADAAGTHATGYVWLRNGAPVGQTSAAAFVDTDVPPGEHTWTMQTQQPSQTDDEPPQTIDPCPDLTVSTTLAATATSVTLFGEVDYTTRPRPTIRMSWTVTGESAPSNFQMSGTGLGLTTVAGTVREHAFEAFASGVYQLFIRANFPNGEIAFGHTQVTVEGVEPPPRPGEPPGPPRDLSISLDAPDRGQGGGPIRVINQWQPPFPPGGDLTGYRYEGRIEGRFLAETGLFGLSFPIPGGWGRDFSGETSTLEYTAIGPTPPDNLPFVNVIAEPESASFSVRSYGPGGESSAISGSEEFDGPRSIYQFTVQLTNTGTTRLHQGSIWALLAIHLDPNLQDIPLRLGFAIAAYIQRRPQGGSDWVHVGAGDGEAQNPGSGNPNFWVRITDPPKNEFRYYIGAFQGGDIYRVSNYSNVVTAP